MQLPPRLSLPVPLEALTVWRAVGHGALLPASDLLIDFSINDQSSSPLTPNTHGRARCEWGRTHDLFSDLSCGF